MTETERGAPRSDSASAQIDWIAAERSPEFKELVKKRRSFVLPATIFFLAWYSAFVLLAGYAPGFMGASIYEGFTVGYALALTQFIMVWVLGGLYLRRADRDFDPLARKAAERAIEVGAAGAGGGGAPSGGASAAPARDSGSGEAPATDGGRDDPASAHEAGPSERAPETGGSEQTSRGGQAPAGAAPPASGAPERPGAGDGGQAPPALRSQPTPGAGQSRSIGGEDR